MLTFREFDGGRYAEAGAEFVAVHHQQVLDLLRRAPDRVRLCRPVLSGHLSTRPTPLVQALRQRQDGQRHRSVPRACREHAPLARTRRALRRVADARPRVFPTAPDFSSVTSCARHTASSPSTCLCSSTSSSPASVATPPPSSESVGAPTCFRSRSRAGSTSGSRSRSRMSSGALERRQRGRDRRGLLCRHGSRPGARVDGVRARAAARPDHCTRRARLRPRREVGARVRASADTRSGRRSHLPVGMGRRPAARDDVHDRSQRHPARLREPPNASAARRRRARGDLSGVTRASTSAGRPTPGTRTAGARERRSRTRPARSTASRRRCAARSAASTSPASTRTPSPGRWKAPSAPGGGLRKRSLADNHRWTRISPSSASGTRAATPTRRSPRTSSSGSSTRDASPAARRTASPGGS